MVSYKVKDNTVKCTLVETIDGKIRKSVGYAHCNPEDKFDEEKGKQIAFTRARIDEIGKDIIRLDRICTKVDNRYSEFMDRAQTKMAIMFNKRDALRRELGEKVLKD